MDSKKLQLAQGSRLFDGVFRRKKAFAFLKVFLTVFFVLAFFGAISIKEFETTSSLDISVSSKDPEAFFKQIISEEIGDQRLSSHVSESVSGTLDVKDSDLSTLNLEQIRDAFDFRIAKRINCNQYRLTAAYVGDGTPAEQNLTRSLVSSLAVRLGSSDSVEQAFAKVNGRFQSIQDRVESNATVLDQDLKSTNQLVDSLNVGLSDIHESVELIRPNEPNTADFTNTGEIVSSPLNREQFDNLLGSLEEKIAAIKLANDERELHQLGLAVSKIYADLRELDLPNLNDDESGSVRIINAAMTESNSAVKAVLELLDELDTDSIQTKLGQIQNNLRVDTIQLREELVGLQSLTNNLTESRYVVNSVSQAVTKPGESAPHFGHIFLFGCFAAGVGMTVASFYQPEIEDVGFADVESAAELLGTPVVACIAGVSDSEEGKEGWANTLIRYCEIGLFGFILLTVILCFIQPDLRNAFFESPFYGLSKMKDLFF